MQDPAEPPPAATEIEAEITRLRAELSALRDEQERLRESEKMYRFSAEIGGRLVWSADSDGNILTLSRGFKSVTGIEDEKALRRGWIEAVHPDDRAHIAQRWAHSMRTGEAFSAEYRAILRDGSTRMVLSRAVAACDKDGHIRRWYGSTQDIHEEREAERARREAEERYRLAVRATNDAVWDYDVVAGTIDWSDNSADIFGVPGERLGRTSYTWWEERIHPDDRDKVATSLGAAFASGRTHWSATYRFLKADGSYADILDRGFIMRGEDGRPVRAVGAMADLTERNRAEAEISRIQTELIHVSRLSAMGAMASTLAHELNQPLTAVTNFLSGARRLAQKNEGVPDPLLEALEAAASSAQRAGEIVRRLRELVSRGTVSVQAENVPRLVEEASVLGFVDAKLHGISHRLDLDPAARWVLADRVQIQQVLINLIRNAIEAMAQSAQREVVIASRAVGKEVEISVADTGPGLSTEQLETLFSRFMTTKSGGMGIGLPISRTIVELHGGKIVADNRPDGGAVFRFTLPKARPPKRKSG